MTKDNTSISNSEKSRKGADDKKPSTAAADGDEHHGYEVSAYLQYLGNKPNSLTLREERLLPMYFYAEINNMSEVVLFKDEKSLAEAGENIESWNEADLLYFKDPRMWVFTIFDMLQEHEHVLDKVFEGPTLKQWLKQTQRRTEAMVTSSITSETIQGVLIGGNVIDTAVAVMMIIVGWTADETTEGRSYCKLMKRLANVTKNTKKISIKAGFALSKTMISSYICLYHSICPVVALVTVYRSGILEQLLRNINIPWLSCDEEESSDDDEIVIRNLFENLCCPTACMHKMLKQGFPFHNTLIDIRQCRIRPCKENEFVMAYVYTLGRFIDLISFKPIGAHIPNPAIALFRQTCTKCRTVDHNKQLLVCARCKFVPYCCKECQVKDWKDHKADCKKFQNEEYKKDKKFIRNFFTKRQNLITEKVKAASVETGLETTELFIDIDFSCSGHDIAPALQDIPKIQIATNLKDFLNEGQKRFIDAMSSKLGKNSVMVFVSFFDKWCIGVVHFELDTYGEIWFMTILNDEI